MTRLSFVLPVRGGAGGAHSVVQEVDAMRSLGIEARILVNNRNLEAFSANYARFDWVSGGGVQGFEGPSALARLIGGAEVLVATTNTSVHSIAEAMAAGQIPALRTGYYVQDYEPLFYDLNSVEHAMAEQSYSRLGDCTYFAKTSWLTDIVRACHGHDVRKVVPSIDHRIFRPAYRPSGGRRLVVAMVRPSTPRRAPRRSLAILGRLAAGEFGDVDVAAFGTSVEELAEHGMTCPDGVTLLGRLSQTEVADLLRRSHALIDLSDYQAFGRSAAEAMACGCIALAPRLGGSQEFIADGVGGFLADTAVPASVDDALRRMLSLTEDEARSVRLAGAEAVATFTPIRAAISELRALGLD